MNDLPPALQASVVMAADQEDCIDELIDAYSRQTASFASYEIALVDHWHHADWREKVAAALARVKPGLQFRYATVDKQGRPAALNRALGMTSAPLVIFTGSDMIPEPDFIARHLAWHQAHPEPLAVGIGPALFPPELLDPFRDWLDETGLVFGARLRPHNRHIPESFFCIANSSLKRELVERLGGFNEQFSNHSSDDEEFSLRLRDAGARSHFVDASGLHRHPVSLQERMESMRKAGESAQVMLRVRPGRYKWQAAIRRGIAWPEFRAQVFRLAHRLTGIERFRQAGWLATLTAEFVRGYKAAAGQT